MYELKQKKLVSISIKLGNQLFSIWTVLFKFFVQILYYKKLEKIYISVWLHRNKMLIDKIYIETWKARKTSKNIISWMSTIFGPPLPPASPLLIFLVPLSKCCHPQSDIYFVSSAPVSSASNCSSRDTSSHSSPQTPTGYEMPVFPSPLGDGESQCRRMLM